MVYLGTIHKKACSNDASSPTAELSTGWTERHSLTFSWTNFRITPKE